MTNEQPACRSLERLDKLACQARRGAGATENTPGPAAEHSDVLRRSHKACGLWATALVGWLACVGVAQEAVPPPRPAEKSALKVDLNPPAPSDAMDAYGFVDRWVRGWNVPERAPEYLPPVQGACVTLRLDGEIVGRGEAMGANALWRALRRAFDEAGTRIAIDRDALADARIREAASRVAISLELAGVPTPLAAHTLEEVARRTEAGFDGVWLRAGEWDGAVFPGRMLAFSQEPAMAATSLLSQAREAGAIPGATGPDPTGRTFSTLVDQGLVRLSTFRVTHLAQPSAGESPVFLSRGGKSVGARWASVASLRELSRAAGDHLLGRTWPGSEALGVMGRYLPAQDRFAPELATASEQAVVALALARLSSCEWASERDRARYRDGSVTILTHLAKVEVGEEPPTTSAGAAGCIAGTLVELGSETVSEHAELGRLFVDARARLGSAFDVQAGFGADVGTVERGAAAWGLACLARTGLVAPDVARSALRQAMSGIEPEQLVSLMPWITWADLELAGEAGELVGGVAWRQVRTWVWAAQAGWDGPPDEAGAIRLAGGEGGFGGLATWASVRPLAGLASLARDARATDEDERLLELARLLEGMRFLRQLQADAACGHMYRSPGRAMGGVRAALFDQRMPPDATSLTILAAVEVLRSIDAATAK